VASLGDKICVHLKARPDISKTVSYPLRRTPNNYISVHVDGSSVQSITIYSYIRYGKVDNFVICTQPSALSNRIILRTGQVDLAFPKLSSSRQLSENNLGDASEAILLRLTVQL
jgi:hypothetical protein